MYTGMSPGSADDGCCCFDVRPRWRRRRRAVYAGTLLVRFPVVGLVVYVFVHAWAVFLIVLS